MQTSIPPTQILFIDGLPGSGKSMAAEAVGRHLPHSRIFLESAPDHPLLAATPDRMGAAFADIHKIHSWDSFAAAALWKLESFLETAGRDVLHVFESHPRQSTVRVLFQLDAPQTSILQFWSDLQDRLAFLQPRLTRGGTDPRAIASASVAFCCHDGIGTPDYIAFAAHNLAYTHPCQCFA